MAKGAWIGIDSKARKIKKAFIGIDGKARKIKKMWIGISDKARLIWSGSGELKYNSALSSGHYGAYDLAAASNSKYAIFAGGQYARYSTTSSTTTFDASLTKSSPTNAIYNGVCGLAATSVGDYALFGGGYDMPNECFSARLNSYNSSLTRGNYNLTNSLLWPTAATIGGYAIFAGGITRRQTGIDDFSNVILSSAEKYDSSLTKSTASALSVARCLMAATSVGSYALFAGGSTSQGIDMIPSSDKYVTTVDTYNTSLTRSTATALSSAKIGMGATSVGNYALFACGYNYGSYNSVIDVYNASLTKSTITATSARAHCAATTLGGFAIIHGGAGSNGNGTTTTEAYDESLTRTTFSSTKGALKHAGATVGNYAVFSGGQSSMSTYSPWASYAEAFQLVE